MSGTLVCFVSLGQGWPFCQMSLCLVHWFVLSLLDRANPFAKCPYVWYTCLLCLPWTESTFMPSVLVSGTLVCYVSLGQSQPLCQVSLCLVHLFVMSLLDRARPLCQMEEEEESGEAQKEGTRRRRTEKVKQFWFLWAMVV